MKSPILSLMFSFLCATTAFAEDSLRLEEPAGDSWKTVSMSMPVEMTWFNQVTGKTETWSGPPPEEKLREYIPQVPDAQALYDLYLEMGKEPIEAAILVLQASVGEK